MEKGEVRGVWMFVNFYGFLVLSIARAFGGCHGDKRPLSNRFYAFCMFWCYFDSAYACHWCGETVGRVVAMYENEAICSLQRLSLRVDCASMRRCVDALMGRSQI